MPKMSKSGGKGKITGSPFTGKIMGKGKAKG